ncbi:MAG: S-formylglutathione hydrolase [Myxococcota bacterium]
MRRVGFAACFDGDQLQFTHDSAACRCSMTFSVYLPPQAKDGPVPLIWWLSGLTCTDQNFVQKAGAQRWAAQHGVAIVAPDTSPRGPDVPGDPDGAWDFGHGASWYVDATQAPWNTHYRMATWLLDELPAALAPLPLDLSRQSIAGHSMGGHGALVLALRNPGRFRAVSAFAPVVAPTQVPWGQKAFGRFFGEDYAEWKRWDTCELVVDAKERLPILVDQGEGDTFLDTQLQPSRLEAACARAGHPLTLRRRFLYDHSYFFVATYLEEHVAWHARALRA